MDILIALITRNFKNSEWTNQEIGYALGRKVPVVSVRIEEEPYGFIAKYQAIDFTNWDNLNKQIIDTLLKNYLDKSRIVDFYISLMQNCNSFSEGNWLSQYLPKINGLASLQIDKIIEIYNQNEQLRGSLGFNGADENYGKGIVYHLNRVIGDDIYKFNDDYLIKKVV